MCVCVRGVGSSDFFHFPKFQDGPTSVIQGEGVKLFTKGVESNCSAIELVIVLDPCPRSRSMQLSQIFIDKGDSLFGCLFSSFIMYPSRDACFTLI